MKKILIVAGSGSSLANFRGDLIRSWIKSGYAVHAIAPEEELADEIKALGVAQYYSIAINRTGTSILGDLKYLKNLYHKIQEIQPDTVLGYTIKPVIYGSIAAKLAGVININAMITGLGYLFVSNTKKAKLLQKISVILYKIGLGCANNVIYQNPDDRDEFIRRGIVKENKCHVVNGSGVNMERFPFSPLPKEFSFLMVSRLLYSKGVMEYFNAAEKVKKQYPDVKFYMLGSIDNKADCIPREIVQPFFDMGIIDYLGTSSDVPSIIEKSSVFVLPSYGEGTPRSVLEAMSMGRPILTTDVAGCRQTVTNNENGFLVPEKNVDALVEKMCWFIDNNNQLDDMASASYNLCLSNFEVSKVNSAMNQILCIFK